MVIQSKSISDLLVKFNMAYCRPAPFPFLSRISLEEGKGTPPMDYTIYWQLIGSLLYLNIKHLIANWWLQSVKQGSEGASLH